MKISLPDRFGRQLARQKLAYLRAKPLILLSKTMNTHTFRVLLGAASCDRRWALALPADAYSLSRATGSLRRLAISAGL